MQEHFTSKYQPKILTDFTINNELIDIIKTLTAMDNLNILFIGNIGTGKTSIINALITEYYFPLNNHNLVENDKHENYYNINKNKEYMDKIEANVLYINNLCEEYPELLEQCRESIEEASKLIIELESRFIDKMFEMGDLENLEADDLKEFIKERTNTKLVELGYQGIHDYDKEKSQKLEWFYHLTGGHTHTDFFAIRPTDYSKANEGEDWDDLF